MGPKYETPSHGNSSSLPKKRGRSGNTTERVMVAAPEKTHTVPKVFPDESPPVPPCGDGISHPPYISSSLAHQTADVKLNALYDPRLLSDYGGTVFHHFRAKLVQRNITDCRGTLIAPWAEYDNLRTGTVVLVRVSLKIYNIQNASKTRKVSSQYFIHFSISAHSVRQLYQLYADRISIALPSDEAVDVRAIKNVDVDGHDKSGDTYDSDDDILKSFNIVVETTNANSSTASSVSVYDICTIATFASHTFFNSVKPH
jgi:hypothetical protein